jgi:hypothetical protein
MEGRPFSKRWFSSILFHISLAWSLFCVLGVGFFILHHRVFKGGLIAMAATFLFAAGIWAIPFVGLIVFHLYLNPGEEFSRKKMEIPKSTP